VGRGKTWAGIAGGQTAAAIEKGIPSRDFRNGGTSDKNAELVKLHGPFTTHWDATDKLAGMLKKGTLRGVPLAAGYQAQDGSGTWMLIDDWGQIDWTLLGDRLKAQ
jgi:hypothetical protein